NNIYQVWKPNGAFYQIGGDAQFQNDMTNAASSPEVGGIVATPQYASGNGWQSEAGGMYQLAAGSPGFDQGLRIANFNDGFLGAAPDVGAAEAGKSAMKFGIAAASATPDTTGTAPTGGGTAPTPPATGTAPISATMDSSAYTTTAGQSVTFTASIMGNGVAPTGNVAFQDGGTAISGCATSALASGKATCTTSALASGTHSITGKYSGDSTYAAGTAGPITQTVNGAGGTSTPGAVPAAPTLVSPSGSLSTTTPAYAWNVSAGATSYSLVVQNTAGVAVSATYPASSLGCGAGTGTCSVTPTAALAKGA